VAIRPQHQDLGAHARGGWLTSVAVTHLTTPSARNTFAVRLPYEPEIDLQNAAKKQETP
jgi:hypothetical protein